MSFDSHFQHKCETQIMEASLGWNISEVNSATAWKTLTKAILVGFVQYVERRWMKIGIKMSLKNLLQIMGKEKINKKWVSDEYLQYPRSFWRVSNVGHIYISCLCHDANGKFLLLSEKDRNEIIVYKHWVFEFENVLEIVINLKSLKC